ncbi:DegV domain-containing protein [Deinococcus piscis]|uniref:DegV domain-containing protein n=1 Tax=Deinococcus piscis TaxID=394230 RepID=A0ABQ3KBG5_9DEIO|nr:DegV family protein [Deinococcus piscis]GHG11545.1 DegV domain-containing protein [Deinococcus piscis]
MIRILTDAGGDIGAATAQRHGITVVPSYVNFGAERLKSDQLTSEELIERVRRSRKLPITSSPNQHDWTLAYQNALKDADEVISIHMPAGLSQSFAEAKQASTLFGDRVHQVDGGVGTYALGYQALRAAELADRGLSRAEIVADLAYMQQHHFVYFMVDTLDYLRMSGRISGVSAFIGNLFGIKPLLKYEHAQVVAAGRARGHRAGVQQISEALSQFAVQQPYPLRLTYLYSPGGEQQVNMLGEQLSSWGYRDVNVQKTGTVTTAIGGPGGMALIADPIRPVPTGR